MLEVVGSGGMGVVYAAYDPKLDHLNPRGQVPTLVIDGRAAAHSGP